MEWLLASVGFAQTKASKYSRKAIAKVITADSLQTSGHYAIQIKLL